MIAKLSARLLAALAVLLVALPLSAAEVIVLNADGPGVGFNDPTPAAPVGGNPGTTRGQQALNVFQQAANVWGHNLVSTQPIVVIATFTPLPCTATGGVLGAAGAYWYFSDIPPAPGGKAMAPGTWYPAALAEKLTRQNVVVEGAEDEQFEIIAFFNSELGKPGCLTGGGWYFGFDNNEPGNLIDLQAVVLHEFGHGLGVAVSPTSNNTGARAQGLPSIWENFMLDATTGKLWINMTNAERAASARNNEKLVWVGQKATNGVKSVLDFRAEVEALDPEGLGSHEAQRATFGPPLGPHQYGYVVVPTDGGGVSPFDGCEPFASSGGIAGNIVLMARGTCNFTVKVLNAQNAGAAAAIISNNTAVGLPGMGGVDPNIVIPSVGISQAFGNALALAPSPFVDILENPQVRTGTTLGYPRLYAPLVFAGGSSVSHFDISLSPNVLMEPFINSNLTSRVKNPDDLTRLLLTDIGW